MRSHPWNTVRIRFFAAWCAAAVLAGVAGSAAPAQEMDPTDYFELDKKGQPRLDRQTAATEDAPLLGTLALTRDTRRAGNNRPRVTGATLTTPSGVKFPLDTQPALERHFDENRPVGREKDGRVAVIGTLTQRNEKGEKKWRIRVSEMYEYVTGVLVVEEEKKKTVYKIKDDLGDLTYTLLPPKQPKAFKQFIEAAQPGAKVALYGTLNVKEVRQGKETDVVWEMTFWKNDPNPD